VRRAYEDLEKRVKDRTLELTKITEHLKQEIEERKRTEEELLKYQEKLRELSYEVSLAEERERRRIASDLHDRIGQALAISLLKLDELRECSLPSGLADSMDDVRALIKQTIQDTRSLTFEISPPVLYDLGLQAAIEWLAEQTQKQHGIRIEFQGVGDCGSLALDSGFRVLIFQMTRELLFNVAKHAKAQHVRVSVQQVGENLCIEVEDDGVGFDPSKISRQKGNQRGFGLFSIRERLHHLGGTLKIQSQLGEGTRMRLICPMNREPEIRNVRAQ
jgi:signal transduction histidine kinase